MERIQRILIAIAAMMVSFAAYADENVIVRKSEITQPRQEEMVRVVVGTDTVPNVLSEKNYGRYDRGLYNYLYIPRKKWAFGFTASYGELNTEDVQVLSILKNINVNGKLYSLKPSISYFFKHNQSIGLRIDYTRGTLNLDNLALDFDSDMSFTLRNIRYYQRSYNMGFIYRNYVGLGTQRRFAVFNEVALDFVTGMSKFQRSYNDQLFDTQTETVGGRLNFSPGVCVFLHEYAAFNVSFGVFGLNYTKETQNTNGIDEGSRISSGANFRFNIFNINFGLMIVI